LVRDHGGDGFVSDDAAVELLARPIPAFGNGVPALLLSAPPVKCGDIFCSRVERLDQARVAHRHPHHGSVQGASMNFPPDEVSAISPPLNACSMHGGSD
jgi:hypothetical protein